MDFKWSAFYTDSQLKRWMQFIPRRFSCRDFADPMQVAQKSALHYAAARVSLPHTRIVVGDCDPSMFYPIPFLSTITGARHYAAVIADTAHEGAALFAGVSGEALILEATSLQLGTCWVAANYRRGLVDVTLEDEEKLLAVIALGAPKDPDGARGRSRKPLSQFCRDDPAAWPLWAYQAAEAMRAAPSAMNRQPWRFSCSGQTMQVGFSGMGLDAGIAVLHAECALRAVPHVWRESSQCNHLLIHVEENDVPV